MLRRLRIAVELTDRLATFPGKWRLLQWIEARPLELQLLPPKLLTLDGGSRLLVEAFNNRGHYVETASLAKDDRVVRLFRALLREGDAVLDVGANIGRMSVLASRLVGSGGSVFSFEPSPKVVSSLYRNLQINGCENVIAHNSAVSDVDGPVTFHMPLGTNSGWGSLRELGVGASLRVEVMCRRLDSMLGALPPIALLKIDVEGADLKVVRGAQQLVQRDQPIIVLEFSPSWIRQLGDDPDSLVGFLDRLGYHLYEVSDTHLCPVNATPNAQIDLLCLPAPLTLAKTSWEALLRLR
jgi:FkbM family methyltransferase